MKNRKHFWHYRALFTEITWVWVKRSKTMVGNKRFADVSKLYKAFLRKLIWSIASSRCNCFLCVEQVWYKDWMVSEISSTGFFLARTKTRGTLAYQYFIMSSSHKWTAVLFPLHMLCLYSDVCLIFHLSLITLSVPSFILSSVWLPHITSHPHSSLLSWQHQHLTDKPDLSCS